jgi:hypothetical protein
MLEAPSSLLACADEVIRRRGILGTAGFHPKWTLSFQPIRDCNTSLAANEVDELIEERLRGLWCSRWTCRPLGSGVGRVEAAKVNLDRAILLHVQNVLECTVEQDLISGITMSGINS